MPPTIGFLLMLSGTGITVKLALRHVQWPTILGWTTIVYIIAIGVITVIGPGKLQLLESKVGTLLAILSGVGAAGGFILMNLALNRGNATEVIPISSAYPVITALLAVFILGESLSRSRMLGIVLVVLGLVALGMSND